MRKNLPYILISFGIASVMCLLSFFDVYDNFEHSLLDMRFKSRGLIETRDDIATADIDVRALQTEGKWDPWSREKHIPLVNLAKEHNLDAFIKQQSKISKFIKRMQFPCFDALTYCQLAEGRLEIVAQCANKIWDIHPIMPIVRASGAIVTTWDNKNPVAGGNIIISNNIVNHNKVLKLLKPVSK